MAPTVRVSYALAMDPTPPNGPKLYRSRYPRAAAWYDALPTGRLSAFPACQANSRLPGMVARDYPQLARLPDMPAAWTFALSNDPFAEEWVPETVLVLQYLLLRDACFADDASFFEATKTRVKASFLTPAMRALMARFSVHLLVMGCSTRWSQYHRGTTLTARSTGVSSLEATLEFPPALYPPLMLEDTRVAMEASIELAHRVPKLRHELVRPGVCHLLGSWGD